MKIRRKEMLQAILLVVTTLFTIAVQADQACGSACNSCAPCGNVITNAYLPAEGAGINPYLNYVATSSGGGIFSARDSFSGFYLGTGFGLGWINYHLNVSGVTPPFLNTNSRSYLLGILNGGFGWAFCHFYLGAEAGYDYRSRSDPISYQDTVAVLSTVVNPTDVPFAFSRPCTVRFDITSSHGYTFDLTPGFLYCNFLGYLRLGVGQSDYDLTRRFCFPLVDFDVAGTRGSAVVTNQDFVFTQNINSGSDYRVGVGFAFAFNRCVSLRFDYIHTFGQKLTFTPPQTDFTPFVPSINGVPPPFSPPTPPIEIDVESGNLLTDITLKPQRDEVVLGLRFRIFGF
jgi:hypothetical protein